MKGALKHIIDSKEVLKYEDIIECYREIYKTLGNKNTGYKEEKYTEDDHAILAEGSYSRTNIDLKLFKYFKHHFEDYKIKGTLVKNLQTTLSPITKELLDDLDKCYRATKVKHPNIDMIAYFLSNLRQFYIHLKSEDCYYYIHENDIIRGQLVLSTLSNADVGQACIAQEGLILGVEAIEGTQYLIERCVNLKRHPNGGVLVKIAKQNQSTLVDLPTIGTDTIIAMHKCKLNGIAISADTTQVLDFNNVIELCNKYNLFLKVVKV